MLDFEDAENECSTQSNSNILNIFDIEQIIDIDKMYFTGTTDPSLEAIFLKMIGAWSGHLDLKKLNEK